MTETKEELLTRINFYIDRILEEVPEEFKEDVKHAINVKCKNSKKENLMTPSDMSDNGLIVLLNHRFLHPLGLALMRDPDTDVILGCLKAHDGKWEYTEDVLERHRENYAKFIGYN